MAFTRIQATPKVIGDSVASVALTFPTPPTVGNVIVVPVILYNVSGPTPTCTDNRSNTYSLAVDQTGGTSHVAIFYCAQIATSGAPFTITLATTPSNYYVTSAVEIGGLGGATLLVDKTGTSRGGGTEARAGDTGLPS